jgi:CO/xanthine dehydrogenase Mo-binding subunit
MAATELIAGGGLARRGVPLIDGIEKITGRALYTADLDHTDALVGRILRSPVSHGDIVRLDVSKARGAPCYGARLGISASIAMYRAPRCDRRSRADAVCLHH